jgi:hypothetical protein
MFSNYPPALDPKDSNYTVAKLTGNTTEKTYPSLLDLPGCELVLTHIPGM